MSKGARHHGSTPLKEGSDELEGKGSSQAKSQDPAEYDEHSIPASAHHRHLRHCAGLLNLVEQLVALADSHYPT